MNNSYLTKVGIVAVVLLLAACKAQDPDVYGQAPPPVIAVPKPPATPPGPTNAPVPPSTPPVVAKFPATNSDLAAVAFEDMTPTRNDEDFNDYLTDFEIFERINAENQVTDIVVDFYPRAVGAWYNHKFLMVLNGVKDAPTDVKHQSLPPLIHGPATATLTYYGPTSSTPLSTEKVDTNHDVMIFSDSHALFTDAPRMIVNTDPTQSYLIPRQRARLQIALQDPSQNPIDPTKPIDISKFRMMLHVNDSNRDIDIIDVDPSNYDQNQQDHNYYPFGFVIPSNWAWPTEGTPIYSAYPSFGPYRDYLHNRLSNPSLTAPSNVMNWFNAAPVAKDVYTVKGGPVPAPTMLPSPW